MNRGVIKVVLAALIGTMITAGVCGCKEAKEYYDRGMARYEKGETDGAISDFTKAIKKKPRYGMAHYYRALTYLREKEYDKAWEDVHKAQSLGQEVRFLETLRKNSGRKK
jgi:tetratricopeptide (TPR) repeat protein